MTGCSPAPRATSPHQDPPGGSAPAAPPQPAYQPPATAGAPAPPRARAKHLGWVIAQSVSSTSYVPCISALQPGWGSSGLQAKDGGTRFTLSSDRSPNHPVHVELSRSCPIGTATPIVPRTPGGRSYLSLSSIDPRYSGTMYDVFPGGCVSYRFDFERGAHVPLMAQLQSIVGFVPRQQLRLDVQWQLGVRLDP
jgi:hypothetical protein